MDFTRGYQVILHDPRLKPPLWEVVGPPSDELWLLNKRAVAPKAWWNIEVDKDNDKVSDLFRAVAMRANIVKMIGIAELDALHIMAHGLQGSIELGADWLHKPTMSALSKISGMFRYVVIHSCLVGKPPEGSPAFMSFTTFGGSQFGRKAAALTKASVVVAREVQKYTAKKVTDPNKAELDFGGWEGPVDVYEDGVPVRTYNNVLDDAFDLEKLIFPAKRP